MKKYTNKYHFRSWVVKTILTVDFIIDAIIETLKFLCEFVLPAFLGGIVLGTALGGITVALLKITGVIS